MGGSGGGGYSPPKSKSSRAVTAGDGGIVGQDSDCDSIHEQLRLQSPVPQVLATLKVGDRLQISVTKGAPPILATTNDGRIAGAIVPSALASVLACIAAGHVFVATVASIKGGICVVRLTAEV